MNSWSEGPTRTRVLRGVATADADFSTVRARSSRDLVVDPALVAEATDHGYRAGYDAGFQAGIEDAAAAIEAREQQRAQQLANAVARLDQAAQAIHGLRATAFAATDQEITEAAFAIAQTLLGDELRHCESRGRLAIQRALQLAPGGPGAVAYLHPDDLATLGPIDDLAPGRNIELVADPSLQPGDAVVDVIDTRIDARLSAALTRVAEALEEGSA